MTVAEAFKTSSAATSQPTWASAGRMSRYCHQAARPCGPTTSSRPPAQKRKAGPKTRSSHLPGRSLVSSVRKSVNISVPLLRLGDEHHVMGGTFAGLLADFAEDTGVVALRADVGQAGGGVGVTPEAAEAAERAV